MKKALVILLALTIILTGCQTRELNKEDIVEGEIRAMVEEYVLSQLKSPSTAKFDDYTFDEAISKVDNMYTYRGYVDSENGFGAVIRTNFKIFIEDRGETLRITSVEFY